jgi:hypothetical protein
MWQSIYRSGNFTGTFEDYLASLVAENVAASREIAIWQGANATAGQFDGFEALLAADANLPAGQEVAGATLSASNIITELGKVRDAAPNALYDAPGFAIRISTAARKFYVSAMAALGYMDKFHEGDVPLNFEGIPLIHCAGLSDNVMVATKEGNLWYGIEDLSLGSQVRFLDQSMVTGSDNVNVVFEWGDGVQYGNVTDIVTYGITNSAN